MKKLANVGLALVLATSMSSMAFAKATPKKGFEATKKMKIKRLEHKLETIEKRLSCIKKAKNAKELKTCEKKYPLVKRGSKKMKKLKKKAKKSK
ncbi:MAG: hypothetical protein C6H99_03755 [Epsilonproteobacteria bacterium]|nr:hypothetical protein [Campylobacterota bacterium]NPA64805.1 hypothetical protein [Campylobacterota bacterium]